MKPPWVAFPVDYPDDPRVIGTGRGGLLFLVRAFCYAGHHETDGFIPERMARQFGGSSVIKKLVKQQLLSSVDGGFYLKDFLAVNPTHERREALREDARKRMRQNRFEGSSREHPDEVRTDVPAKLRGPQGQGQIQEEINEPSADATGSTSSKKKARKTHENRGSVMDLFTRYFAEATGQKPSWRLKKNRGLADTLAGMGTLEEIEARLRRCYSDRKPDFLWNDGSVPDIGSFVANFDKFVEQTASAAQTARVKPWQCPTRQSQAKLKTSTDRVPTLAEGDPHGP